MVRKSDQDLKKKKDKRRGSGDPDTPTITDEQLKEFEDKCDAVDPQPLSLPMKLQHDPTPTDLYLELDQRVKDAKEQRKDENTALRDLVDKNKMLQDMLLTERRVNTSLNNALTTTNHRRWRFVNHVVLSAEDNGRRDELLFKLREELKAMNHPFNQLEDETQRGFTDAVIQIQKELFLIDLKYDPSIVPPFGCSDWIPPGFLYLEIATEDTKAKNGKVKRPKIPDKRTEDVNPKIKDRTSAESDDPDPDFGDELDEAVTG